MSEYIKKKKEKKAGPPARGERTKDSSTKPIIIKMGENEIMGTFDAEGKIKFKTGGRAGLRGGGICKKGMNRKAIGKNS